MRKEMDELKSAIKEKIDRSLDCMVRRIDSPFTTTVLECPMPSKFRLLQLGPFDRLKDPLDHLNTFKTTLGLQQPPDEILCRSFQLPLKELRGSGSRSYQRHPSTTSSSWATPFYANSSEDNAQKGWWTTCLQLNKEKKRPWGRTWSISSEKL